METHRIPVGGNDEEIVIDYYPTPFGEAKGVGVFVHGFASDRKGEKAVFFAEAFNAIGWAFAAIDLRGHGDASGDMRTLTMTRSIEDLIAALNWIPLPSPLPRVLIGSSMGGAVTAWAIVKKQEIADAIIWIAPSLTFPNSFVGEMTDEIQQQWKNDGELHYQNEWLDIVLGYQMVEDGRTFHYEDLIKTYNLPTLIFHGVQDDAVPWQASIDFLKDSPSSAIDLVLVKEGDHRMTDHKDHMAKVFTSWLQQRFPKSF